MNQTLLAQNEEKGFIKSSEDFYYQSLPKDSILHPFYNGIIFYAEPNFGSKQLYKSTNYNLPIKFKETTDKRLNYKGILGTWYKVLCKTPQKAFFAYVPQQVFAVGFIKNSSFTYLLGISRFEPTSKFTYTVKVLKSNQLITNYDFDNAFNLNYYEEAKNMEFAVYTKFELFSNKGLTNINNILKVSTFGEACGVWGGANYLMFDLNNKVVSNIQTKYMGDADVYGYDLNIIFPLDSNTLNNEVLFIINIYEYLDEETGKETFEQTILRKKWNLNTFVQTDSTYKIDTTYRKPE